MDFVRAQIQDIYVKITSEIVLKTECKDFLWASRFSIKELFFSITFFWLFVLQDFNTKAKCINTGNEWNLLYIDMLVDNAFEEEILFIICVGIQDVTICVLVIEL